jgi:hypothetical protein
MLLSELLNCINDNNQEVKKELEVVKKEVEVVTTRLLDWNCGSSKSTNKVMCTINHGVNSINNNNDWVEAFVLILLLHRNKSIDYYTIDKRRLLSVLIIQVLSNLIDSDNDNTNVSVLVLILLLKLSICTIRKENNRTGNDDVCDFALISLLDHTHTVQKASLQVLSNCIDGNNKKNIDTSALLLLSKRSNQERNDDNITKDNIIKDNIENEAKYILICLFCLLDGEFVLILLLSLFVEK